MSAFFCLGVIVLGFASGCASITSGQHQEVTFHSSPDGVTVTSHGESLGTTPAVLDLKRGKDLSLEFAKEGYHKQS